jgi:hypothetical protein
VNKSGHYFVRVNPSGCWSDTSNVIYALAVGIGTKSMGNFSMYPNPGKGKVTIRLNAGGEKRNLSVRVTDLLGREIFRMTENMATGGIKREIDLGSPADGIYTLILQFGNEQLIRKILVEK